MHCRRVSYPRIELHSVIALPPEMNRTTFHPSALGPEKEVLKTHRQGLRKELRGRGWWGRVYGLRGRARVTSTNGDLNGKMYDRLIRGVQLCSRGASGRHPISGKTTIKGDRTN